jgi:hypothetical protein
MVIADITHAKLRIKKGLESNQESAGQKERDIKRRNEAN